MKTIEDYIDDRNRSLYLKLIEKHQIELIKSEPTGTIDDYNWKLSYSQGVFKILYYKDTEQCNFFTHELFHIDLIDKGFSDFPEILPLIKEGNKNYVFLPIIGHLNNVFAHEKFYNDFINLGYLPSDFVSDYDLPFDVEKITNEIEKGDIKTGFPYSDISKFIQHYFTIKDNRNPLKDNTCSEVLAILKSRNNKLFDILDNTWTSWQNSKSLSSKDFLNHLFEQTELLIETR